MHHGDRLPMLRLLTLVAAAATLAATGCEGAPKTSDRSLSYVGPAEAEQLVAGGRRGLLGLGPQTRAVWVDPRGERAYRAGHIEGAVSMPLARASQDHAVLSGYDVIVVYGDDFRDPVAEAMSKRLMTLGYDDVRTLRGGIRAWTGSGRELSTGD